MITIDKIKEYIKCPQFGDTEYGKWGSLKLEQREAYRHLIDIIEGLEKEIDRLNNREKSGAYECFHCLNNSVTWQSDYNFEDYGYEGDGIIQVLKCSSCGADIEYKIPITKEK